MISINVCEVLLLVTNISKQYLMLYHRYTKIEHGMEG